MKRLAFVLPLILVATASGSVKKDRGAVVVLDAATGHETAHLAADGAVVAAVSDGRGGWFVGGSFTRIGGRREVALAHILPRGGVDPSWRSRIGSASGRRVAVFSLARAGSHLFAAGPFGRVGGLRRPGLAAVDARSGRVLAGWRPQPLLWLDVTALAVAGARLLVAGQFGYPTAGIAALSVRTGAVDRRWDPHLRLIGDAGGFSTLLVRRSHVYVAGSFHVYGLSRNGLVALGLGNGLPDPRWAPRVPDCAVCRGFAVVYGLAASGRRMYVSGAFGRGLVALDPRTGAADSRWRAQRGGPNVFRLVLAGQRLYAGGERGLWALSARSGSLLPGAHVREHVLGLALWGRKLLAVGRL